MDQGTSKGSRDFVVIKNEMSHFVKTGNCQAEQEQNCSRDEIRAFTEADGEC